MKTDQTPLHRALADLATTMSPNPDRLRQVRQRVDRRRRRRMATGAAVSAGAVAATVGIAMVPRESRSSLQFNVAGTSLPECASIPAPAPPPTPPGKTPVVSLQPAEPDVVRYKGIAVVTQTGAGTVTLGDLTMDPVAVPPSGSIVMIVDAVTTFENKGLLAAPSELAVGQRVLFSASIGADGRDHLDYVELAGDIEVQPPATEDDKAAEKAAQDLKGASVPADSKEKDEPATDGIARGKAVIAAAPVNELSVLASVDGGDLQPLRLLLGPDTRYFRFETACANAALVVGSSILFSAVPNGDGTYTATELRTYE